MRDDALIGCERAFRSSGQSSKMPSHAFAAEGRQGLPSPDFLRPLPQSQERVLVSALRVAVLVWRSWDRSEALGELLPR